MGIGPGGALDRTPRAEKAISESQVVVGYSRYLDYIKELTTGKEIFSSGMTCEEERCRAAVTRADAGAKVALVSSGDPGVYGMAGLALEIARLTAPGLPVEIIPGISAANAAAAVMGAPLMLDYAVISLSDLLVPWDMIRRRLEAVASADLVAALYNPRSRNRVHQMEDAVEIFLRYREAGTPAGVGTAVGTPQEHVELTVLGDVLSLEINMHSVVIIGNTHSKSLGGRFITPRGYRL